MIQPINNISFGGKFLDSKVANDIINNATKSEKDEFYMLQMRSIFRNDGRLFNICRETTFNNKGDSFVYIGLQGSKSGSPSRSISKALLSIESEGEKITDNKAFELGILAPLRKLYD